jgi:hypothetical protein
MKVRITGTITLITNDHKKDRSFRFLDTFNKKGDKWEMIATGLTATNELPAAIDKNSIESQLTGLENSLSRSAVGNDRSVLENMIATDFVGTTADGVLQTRKEWLSSIETQRYKTQVDNVVVHLVSDTVAIVIGTLLENRTDNSSPSKQRFTHTWMNREGHWQLVASQLTAIR